MLPTEIADAESQLISAMPCGARQRFESCSYHHRFNVHEGKKLLVTKALISASRVIWTPIYTLECVGLQADFKQGFKTLWKADLLNCPVMYGLPAVNLDSGEPHLLVGLEPVEIYTGLFLRQMFSPKTEFNFSRGLQVPMFASQPKNPTYANNLNTYIKEL